VGKDLNLDEECKVIEHLSKAKGKSNFMGVRFLKGYYFQVL